MKTMLYALVFFLLVGCSEDASTQDKVVEQEAQVKEQPKVETKEVVQPESEPEAEQEIKPELEEKAKQEAKPKLEKEVKQEVKPKIEEIVKQEIKSEPKQKIVVAKKDGATLYKSCIACHGADASKVALGKSVPIKGWSAQRIADALNGYKNGTYGGALKALMSGQVAKLSPEEIEVLAEYIAEL